VETEAVAQLNKASRNNGKSFVICVKNRGYAASLELRKVYLAVNDRGAESHGLIRVIDESGEDYLFPESFFALIDIRKTATRLFAHSA